MLARTYLQHGVNKRSLKANGNVRDIVKAFGSVAVVFGLNGYQPPTAAQLQASVPPRAKSP